MAHCDKAWRTVAASRSAHHDCRVTTGASRWV